MKNDENSQNNILNDFSQTDTGKYGIEDNSLRMWILPVGRSEIANEA